MWARASPLVPVRDAVSRERKSPTAGGTAGTPASTPAWTCLALLLILLMCSGGSSAYSVLTHEQIVDLLWTDALRPLLLQRYPGLTEEQITEAHAYAYGGAVIQDLGYYPFGSVEFSNLVHYVRSGDFVLRAAAPESGC